MKNKSFIRAAAQALLLTALFSCESFPAADEPEDTLPVSLEELAQIFSHLPLEKEHLDEVHTAVSSSLEYGYDEEYTMADLFTSPGAGVGSRTAGTKAPADRWSRPLRTLLEDYLEQAYATRAGDAPGSASEYISALTQSDVQIYWPYSEDWDGTSLPVITFDPGGTMEANYGYEMRTDGSVKEVVVTEKMARERPVWVMNRNDDSEYQTIEMLRRQDPDWGKGGTIVVQKETKADDDYSGTKTLILKEFEASRNYDSWFAGGSEFFVKAGAVEDFNASTEAEMRLYSPSITDFMVVVKRSQIGQKIPFHAVLVSEWTEQLQSLAFLVTEDDGGTITTWKATANVKVKSKTYGIDIEIPFNSRDDIVWRGQLTRKYFEKNNDVEGHFGDVWLTFGII